MPEKPLSVFPLRTTNPGHCSWACDAGLHEPTHAWLWISLLYRPSRSQVNFTNALLMGPHHVCDQMVVI